MIENKITRRDTEESMRFWAESDQREKDSRKAYLERAKQVGASLNATLVAVWKPRSGEIGDPAVYQRSSDGAYFHIIGEKDKVAGTEDSEEIRKGKILIKGKPEILDKYAIATFNLEEIIKEGFPVFTPEGYIE